MIQESKWRNRAAATFALVLSAAFLATLPVSRVSAKQKGRAVDPNDPTNQLFQLLDSKYADKPADIYILTDVYKNPKDPSEELQHVVRVDYEKNRLFGKLKIHVRSVAKVTSDQQKTYTPKEIYEFAQADSEKYVKTDFGPFGGTGDLYLRALDDNPPTTSPITEDEQKAYEHVVTDYILPALQKK